MASITVSGIGGGVDVPTLVSKLMQSERTALNPLTKEASGFNSKLSSFKAIQTALTNFQSAMDDLNNLSFAAQKAAVSNTGANTAKSSDAFTATVNTDTSTKALSQKIESAGIAAGTKFTSGDTMGIQVGSQTPVFITLGSDMTLEGVKDTINKSKTGVSASIRTDSSGQHLVLESSTAGTGNTIKVSGVGSLQQFAYGQASTSSMTQTQAPRDLTAAAAGAHEISVTQLAQGHKLKSAAIKPDTTFKDGILAIKTTGGSTTLITPKTNSLAGVRDAINASDAGVTASIVSDSTSSYLVLNSKETGEDSTIKITGTGDFSVFNYEPGNQLNSGNVASGHTFASGTLTLGYGSNSSIDLNLGASATLDTIKEEINKHTTASGVSATVVTEGGNQRLQLTSSNGSPISLTGTNDYTVLNGKMMGQTQKAQDAEVVIDGVTIKNKSNKIENAISGITLDLNRATTTDDNYKMSVSNDTSSVNTALNKFIDAYNTLAQKLNDMTKYDAENKTAGELQGDSTARSIITQLRNTMTQGVSGNGDYNLLSSIGVTFQKDGTFKLDYSKFTKIADGNFASIAGLLNSDTGVIGQMKTLTKSLLGDDGILKDRISGLEKSLKVNSERQTAMETRFASMKDRYTDRFNSLNTVLSNMQSQSSYLASALASLPKN